jgi:hypothetical protein
MPTLNVEYSSLVVFGRCSNLVLYSLPVMRLSLQTTIQKQGINTFSQILFKARRYVLFSKNVESLSRALRKQQHNKQGHLKQMLFNRWQ